MTRTGRVLRLAALLLLAGGAAFAEELEFYQTVDLQQVGTEDTLRLSVVMIGAPAGARLSLPELGDFEVLSRAEQRSRDVQMSGAGAQIRVVTKVVLVLRPKRAGNLTIGPASLEVNGGRKVAEAIQITAVTGSLVPPQQRAQPRTLPDPFADFFGRGNQPRRPPPEPEIPRSDSDLFLRTYLDATEAFVGQQVNMTVYVFSRVDLMGVEKVTFPQLEGFWSEDVDSPTQLTAEQRVINGIPYRAYLLKRKVLFPTRVGALEIAPVEAEISTGYLFSGHKVQRKGNRVELKVKPLPPGLPQGFASTHVGRWQLSLDVTPLEVRVGEPLTVKVALEGRGNLKNVGVPRLVAPPGFRVFEPTTTDRLTTRGGVYGGRRVQEYLVMPGQTGTFTFPELTFSYFDPESGSYEVARSEPIEVSVFAAGSPGLAGSPSPLADADAAKNVLTTDGIYPLRHAATLGAPGLPPWRRPWFVPALLSPLGLWLALGLVGLARTRLGQEDEGSSRRRKARAARRRLLAAEKLRTSQSSGPFFAEVEKALYGFCEARLGEPLIGLTHEALGARLALHGLPLEARAKILGVLETCELGRFSPGGADLAARDRLLEEAEAAMAGLERR